MNRSEEVLNRVMNIMNFNKDLFEKIIDSHERKEPGYDWPDYCLIPEFFLAPCFGNGYDTLPISLQVTVFYPIIAWRYSKGIYKFDSKTLDALKDTPIGDKLPVDVLLRLPEFGIYVELENEYDDFYKRNLLGFYVAIDYDPQKRVNKLNILLDLGDFDKEHGDMTEFFPFYTDTCPLTLHEGTTLTDSILESLLEEMRQNRAIFFKEYDEGYVERIVKSITPLVKKIISILLYICSDAPEIDDSRVPNLHPSHNIKIKTKRGYRVFPAEKTHIWNVGKQIGEKLRVAEHESLGLGKKRPHLRRGHWHGFWTGPRKNTTKLQKFVYHWLPPIFVDNESKEDDSID